MNAKSSKPHLIGTQSLNNRQVGVFLGRGGYTSADHCLGSTYQQDQSGNWISCQNYVRNCSQDLGLAGEKRYVHHCALQPTNCPRVCYLDKLQKLQFKLIAAQTKSSVLVGPFRRVTRHLEECSQTEPITKPPRILSMSGQQILFNNARS